MNRFLLFFLTISAHCFAQENDYVAHVTSHKTSISVTDTFLVDVEVTGRGRLFIGFLTNAALDVIGADRHEIVLTSSPQVVQFTLRSNEAFLRPRHLSRISFGIAFSPTQFASLNVLPKDRAWKDVALSVQPVIPQKSPSRIVAKEAQAVSPTIPLHNPSDPHILMPGFRSSVTGSKVVMKRDTTFVPDYSPESKGGCDSVINDGDATSADEVEVRISGGTVRPHSMWRGVTAQGKGTR